MHFIFQKNRNPVKLKLIMTDSLKYDAFDLTF